MSQQIFPYIPIGGINGEDSEDRLEETQVQTATNFLFERKMFLNRPGVYTYKVNQAVNTPIATTPRYAQSFRSLIIPTRTYYTLLIGDNNLTYTGGDPSTDSSGAPILLFGATAGAALTLDYTYDPRMEYLTADVVNGAILIGNNTGGLIRIDLLTAGFHTIIASSAYRYITAFGNRAVAAYALPPVTGAGNKVAWSQDGDETLWTGGDSGSSTLADSVDEITGLKSIHNVLVVMRRSSIRLGTLTGISTPVFRFEPFSKENSGCPYPSTLACYDNKLYYVSQDNVCSFDLQQVVGLGNQIRTELFSYLNAGVKFRGFVSRVMGAKPRLFYHLVPFAAVNVYQVDDVTNSNGFPHFVLDLQEMTWSRHLYSFALRGGFNYFTNEAIEAPTLLGEKTAHRWDPDLPCESIATLLGRSITIGPEEVDVTVRRLLIKCRNFGVKSVVVRIRGLQTTAMVENTYVLTTGTVAADLKLTKAWANVGLAGQNFEVSLEIPAGQKFAGTYIGFKVASGGEFKGDPGL